MRFLTAFLVVVFSITALADKFNTLQWNRHNMGTRAVDRGPWYEWWYYKVVSPEFPQGLLFVYGTVNPWDLVGEQKASRAYVTVGSFDQKFIIDDIYKNAELEASYETPFVRVANNYATDRALKGEVVDKRTGKRVSWDLYLEKDWGFNAMGWAMSLRWASNIFWYPAQASALMSGRVTIDGKTVELRDAPAYQDRNWGRSFPKWWAWLVSNNFKNSPGTVLAAGGGRPKLLGALELMQGMNVGFFHQGKSYNFRINDGARVSMKIRFGVWELVSTNLAGQRIKISAAAPKEKFMDLTFQTPQNETYHDYETLTGSMRVLLQEWRGFSWATVADLQTDEAGIEFGSREKYPLEKAYHANLVLFDSAQQQNIQ